MRAPCFILVALMSGLVLVAALFFYSNATIDVSPTGSDTEEVIVMTLELTSPAFSEGEAIPCTGEDVSPALAWTGVPEGTQSIALIMDDPDAPGRTWDHWVIYNLPPDTTRLPEAIRSDGDLPAGAVHGRNSWNRNDYGGPCPPSGTHRYFFKLYALDAMLDLPPGAAKQALLDAMAGHILAETQLMGTYQK